MEHARFNGDIYIKAGTTKTGTGNLKLDAGLILKPVTTASVTANNYAGYDKLYIDSALDRLRLIDASHNPRDVGVNSVRIPINTSVSTTTITVVSRTTLNSRNGVPASIILAISANVAVGTVLASITNSSTGTVIATVSQVISVAGQQNLTIPITGTWPTIDTLANVNLSRSGAGAVRVDNLVVMF